MDRLAAVYAARTTDFLTPETKDAAPVKLERLGKVSRPPAFQAFLNIAADIFLSPSTPEMAHYVAAKVFHRLDHVGSFRPLSAFKVSPHSIIGAISTVAASGGRYADLAANLTAFSDDLVWRRGKGGPFASINFDRAHALATIIGPGGLEERNDIRMGLIFMEPYNRFPDHLQEQSRAFLFLSPAEICLGDSPWSAAKLGTVVANETGQRFAMRCTGEPLLALWCDAAARPAAR